MICNNKKILCGIVTYNPEITRFLECIESLKYNVKDILIYDNASQNINEIKKFINDNNLSIKLYDNNNNAGIAHGLRYIMHYAVKNQYDYVLTLDQDSIVKNDLINEYLKFIESSDTGALTCIIKDRNNGLCDNKNLDNIEECKFAITSGFFIKVSAYNQIKGYDEKLFIDNVDFDLCCQLREKGFKIYKIPFYGIYHEIGHSVSKKVFGKNISSYMHNSKRKYYIGRNTIYELRKFPKYYTMIGQYKFLIVLFIKILILEDDKYNKIKSLLKGINDGYKLELN